MAIRYRTSILVAFVLLVLYYMFWNNEAPFQSGSHAVDVLKNIKDTQAQGSIEPRPPVDDESQTSRVRVSTSSAILKETSVVGDDAEGGSSTSSAVAVETIGGEFSASITAATSVLESGSPKSQLPGASQPTIAPVGTTQHPTDTSLLQEQFYKDYDALGVLESAGAIYGKTINHLVGTGANTKFHAAALTPYSDTPPYEYKPYPEYNSATWKASNVGEYVPCDEVARTLGDVLTFSGHHEIFMEPLAGSYAPLDIESNVCFERETRLGTYGYFDEESGNVGDGDKQPAAKAIWDTVDWKVLQEKCVGKNANRYAPVKAATPQASDLQPAQEKPTPAVFHGTGDAKRVRDVADRAEIIEGALHGSPEVKAQVKPRTAILLRASKGKNYTDNDVQNIRSLVTELSLRSGGEYTVYLLIEAENSEKALWSDARDDARNANVPKEFQGIAIFWNDAMMKEFYPKSETETEFHRSEWRPVQRFAHDYPQYEFFWNLNLDYRYTGHHYDLYEKLAAFAKAQPRKGLWERNERFYIPSLHGAYETKFRDIVEAASGQEMIWGAPSVEGVKPVGPIPPVMDPRDDDYIWGVGEEADYISLSPIFNPVNTNWTGKDDMWGYIGADLTPRRATVGMNARCSKKLLATMDHETARGNHIGSEMGPQTVALLHGMKAVYAPIPIFFDRAWNGSSLAKFLNPGPKGECGSSAESPFSEGMGMRFEGSTWHEQAVVPRRLYNNWMGWEYRGIGGPEWEKAHGRVCLPPLLLHPIKDVTKPPPDHASKS